MSVGRTDSRTAVLETTWGRIVIRADASGVRSCALPRPSPGFRTVAFKITATRLPASPDPVLRRAAAYARAMLAGRDPGAPPRLAAAALAEGSPFRRAVWAALRRIPRGRTLTYAALARRAGRPGAARAVGNACGANPLPLFQPCHRVVAAGGRLGGFSAGAAWKRRLLAGEGAPT